MALAKISTFDDWIDAFRQWKQEIGLELAEGIRRISVRSQVLGDLKSDEIEYGDFAGEPEVGANHADPAPAGARRASESDRLPGRHRIRVGRTAALPASELPVEIRPRFRLPHHGRRDAPRLADVPHPRDPVRRDRAASRRGSSSSAAPGTTIGCSARSTSTSITGSTSSRTRSSSTGTASSSSTCSPPRRSRRWLDRWARC